MTRSVPDNQKFRLYIETLGQLRNGHGEFMLVQSFFRERRSRKAD